jgi:sec-independent protein translocase protein TatB
VLGSLGWLEIVTLIVVALLVFGPDKLPGVAKDAAQMLRQLRSMAKDARGQIKSELGPEFSDFDLDSLNPRTFVRKNLFEDGDDDDPPRRNGARPADDRTADEPAPRHRGTAGTADTPYDPDTT